jgi:hypothetical protein
VRVRTSVTAALRASEPLGPVTVNGSLPVGTLAATLSASALETALLAGGVTVDGREPTVQVPVALPPGEADSVVGFQTTT